MNENHVKVFKDRKKKIFPICTRQNWWFYNYTSHYVPFKRKGVSDFLSFT